jgi:hypothetical protein
MLPSLPVLGAETRAALLTDSRELDYRTLLRALRERVVDGTGLLEDGSAGNAWEPILGRYIESAEYRREMREQALEPGAQVSYESAELARRDRSRSGSNIRSMRRAGRGLRPCGSGRL